MKYLSLFSGIEAASVAWEPLGWQAIGFSEIDSFASAVLAHRYPNIKNYGDMTKYKEWGIERGTIDVLVGGSPCQSFSVAGLRRGLEDERGNLMLEYANATAFFRPKFFCWENVPGVLSSGRGQDFASFLGLLTGRKVSVPESGWRNSGILAGIDSAYGIAWSIRDAQYFGVAQRRRRVFVVGYLGDWRRAAAVLFESESLCGNLAPSRETGKGVALPIGTRVDRGGSHREGEGNNLIAPALRAKANSSHRADMEAFAVYDGRGPGGGRPSTDALL